MKSNNEHFGLIVGLVGNIRLKSAVPFPEGLSLHKY
jgi:hypothetical protein